MFQGKMLDLIFAVDDPLEWHQDNLQWNSHHYSFLRHFGPDAIVKLQRVPAGVFYNTLLVIESQVVIVNNVKGLLATLYMYVCA